MMDSEEQKLYRHFQELRKSETALAPSFSATWRRAQQRQGGAAGLPWMKLSGAAAILLAAAVILWSIRRAPEPVQIARSTESSAIQWLGRAPESDSPTEFLLNQPSELAELLNQSFESP